MIKLIVRYSIRLLIRRSTFQIALFLLLCFATDPARGLLRFSAHSTYEARLALAHADSHDLTPLSTVVEELAGNTLHSYEIDLRRGDHLRILLAKADLHVAITLFTPTGQQSGEFISKRFGPLQLSLIAEMSGRHRIEIRSLEQEIATKSYELRVEAVRNATAQDREYDLAMRSFAEAEELCAGWEEKAFREAIQKYTDAWMSWQSIGYQGNGAEALRQIGEVHFALSEYPQALVSYRRALNTSRAAKDRPAERQALNDIGYVYVYMGQSNKALSYFKQVLNYYSQTSSTPRNLAEQRGEAQTLNNMGEAFYSLGELKKALDYFKRARTIWQDAGDRSGQALAHINIGYAHSDSGDLQKALEHFKQALNLWREVGHKRGEALSLTALGTIHSFLGETQLALNSHKQAMQILQALGDRQGEAVALNSTGKAYEDLNELQVALDNYLRALEIYKTNGNRDFESVTRYYIGRVYNSLGKTQQALDYYQQSISLSREVSQRRVEAYALTAVSTIDNALGHKQKALSQYYEVLKLYRSVGDRRGQAHTLNNLGHIYRALGEPQKALRYYQQALLLTRAAGDRNGEAATLYNLARAARETGALNEAVLQIEESIKIIESLRVQVASQALRTSYFASVQRHYGLYIDLLMLMHKRQPTAGFAAQALCASESARVRSLLEILTEARADIRQGVTPALLERERSLQELLSAKATYQMRLLNNKRTEAEAEEVNKEIRQLTMQYQEVQAQIREQSPRYAALMQPVPLRLEDIQAELQDSETMLLEYALGDEKSYLWAVTATSITSYELPEGLKIEEAAREVYRLLTTRQVVSETSFADYQERASASEQQYWQQASALSQMLLGPVASQLGTKRLLIVADGALQYVPFEALPIPATSEQVEGSNVAVTNHSAAPPVPIVLEHEVVLLPSASTLALLRREQIHPEPTDKLIAVLADPVFEKDDPRVQGLGSDTSNAATESITPSKLQRGLRDFSTGDSSSRIPRLPATRQEAEAILAVTSNNSGKLATDFEASRDTALSAEVSRYRIVHFATHGIINSEQPELSGIILSMVDRQGRYENGFLQMHDVYNLKLSADLIVLSACSTGLGKDLKGEGLVGLTRGFMYAGSKSVIASLWQVNDKATAELMKHFYKALLQDGMPVSAALRAAKEKMWKQGRWRSPYFWAAFVLQGEYKNSVKSADPALNSTQTALLLVAALALLSGSFIVLQRIRRNKLR